MPDGFPHPPPEWDPGTGTGAPPRTRPRWTWLDTAAVALLAIAASALVAALGSALVQNPELRAFAVVVAVLTAAFLSAIRLFVRWYP